MNNKRISIISIILAAVFTSAVIFLICGIAGDYAYGTENSKYTFNSLSAGTAGIASRYPAGSKEFADAFCNASFLTDDVASVTLDKYGSRILNYPAGNTSADYASPLIHTFSTHIGTPEDGLMITAAVYVLKPSSIFNRARIAFFIILTGTLVSALLIVYLHLSSSPAASEMPPVTETQQEPVIQEETEPQTAQAVQDTLFSSEVPIDETDDMQPEEEKPENSAAVPDSDLSDAQPVEEQSVEPSTETSNEAVQPDASEPSGLFSPSGLGWESYLLPRLNSELVRAASSEQDLSLFIIRIPGFDRTSKAAKDICQLLIDHFTFPDMLFEYKEDGYAAIKLNETVDTALTNAEEIHADITSILRSENCPQSAAIGISSRSLRIITGERLLKEADQAAEHALEDTESAIIAFKVNPDKYRKYITDPEQKTNI